MAKRKAAEAPCPLFLHRGSGQWAKKIGGKTRYFGKDKDAALEKWQQEERYRLAGVEPPRYQREPSVTEAGNVYADFLRRQVANGELDARTAEEYKRSIRRFISIAGSDRRIGSLGAADFGRIKEALFEPVAVTKGAKRPGGRIVKRRAVTTVAIDVRNLRVFFNWCARQKIAPAPEYGDEFSAVSRKALRRKRAADGPRDLSAEAIRAILERCKPPMRAIVLLGINAGLGNKDIADIRLSDLPKLKGEVWLDMPRGKTGAPRRFVLWDETRDAIAAYLMGRPSPAGSDNRDRLFLTRIGQAWVRRDGTRTTDAIGAAFAKARQAARLPRGTFYDLRRTFRTRAAGTMDREAVDFVMGHVESADDMGAIYNQWIADERIRKVCNHVRNWLFGEVAK